MVQSALFFEPEPVPSLPGPAVGPKEPKIGQKPRAGFIILSSLRSAQEWDLSGVPESLMPRPALCRESRPRRRVQEALRGLASEAPPATMKRGAAPLRG